MFFLVGVVGTRIQVALRVSGGRRRVQLVRLDLDLTVGAHRLVLALREGLDNEVLGGDARFSRPLAAQLSELGDLVQLARAAASACPCGARWRGSLQRKLRTRRMF